MVDVTSLLLVSAYLLIYTTNIHFQSIACYFFLLLLDPDRPSDVLVNSPLRLDLIWSCEDLSIITVEAIDAVGTYCSGFLPLVLTALRKQNYSLVTNSILISDTKCIKVTIFFINSIFH